MWASPKCAAIMNLSVIRKRGLSVRAHVFGSSREYFPPHPANLWHDRQTDDRNHEMQSFAINAIGKVSCTRREAGDDYWDKERSEIALDPGIFTPQATTGLEAFSHIEVIYLFDQVSDGAIQTGSRRPRNNPDWPEVGILAQRGKNRPNKIGATICRLLSVDGLIIQVAGLDAIDGTPVLDVKPVLSGFLPRSEVLEPHWAKEIMTDYW